jgi:hypothetical protein
MTSACPIFGFLVEFEIQPDEADYLWKSFEALLEERGLEADGGRGYRLWTFRLSGVGAPASDLDRRAVIAWANSHAAVRSVSVGDLFDILDAV